MSENAADDANAAFNKAYTQDQLEKARNNPGKHPKSRKCWKSSFEPQYQREPTRVLLQICQNLEFKQQD